MSGAVRTFAALGSYSLTGRGRSHDEDRVATSRCGFGAIADGVGGMPAGGLFAEAVAWEALRALEESGARPDEALRSAHGAARRLAIAMGVEPGSGASAACIALDGEGTAEVARVGDVAVYQVGPSGAHPLLSTAEHRDGRRRLTSYAGMRVGAPHVDRVSVALSAGELVLMVTDGVADYLSCAAIADAVRHSGPHRTEASLDRAARDVVLAAIAHGSCDDASCLVAARL